MKKISVYIKTVAAVAVIIGFSIFGPAMLAEYTDAGILENVHSETGGALIKGYRYQLTANQRLYILSMALTNQDVAQSKFTALTKETNSGGYLQAPSASFAFITNYRGPSDNELPSADVLAACQTELTLLHSLGVIPACQYDSREDFYSISLHSAVDVLEPQRNVSVWQIGYSSRQAAGSLNNTLLDAWVDAETGKLYGFSIRTDQTWENCDPDKLMREWCSYLGLGEPEAYGVDTRLMESTPYYKKYTVDGMSGEKTIVTIGFYEGVNELFLRISQ